MQISPSRRYWLVRTKGGKYYEDFIKKQMIAIGWDQTSDIKLINESSHNPIRDKQLKTLIKEAYFKKEKQDRSGYVSNQIKDFVNEIKLGDIVLIPSENSSQITFGEVESDIYLEEYFENHEFCRWTKRRKMGWIKTVSREELDPYLYKLFFSHHAVSSADQYAEYIDRTLFSLFIKGNAAHLILDVQKSEPVPLQDFLNLLSASLNLVNLFNKEMNEKLDSSNINIKTSINSPGPIEIYGSIETVLYIALFFSILLGGKFFGFEFKEGLFDKVLKFINESHSFQIEKAKLSIAAKRLDIKELDIGIQEQEIPFMDLVENARALPEAAATDEDFHDQKDK